MNHTNLNRRVTGLPAWRYWILGAFVAIKFVLQYHLTDPVYELHRDEFLHLDLGNHLAWGYLSVPPFISWVAWLIGILGNGIFWVKFFPALFGAITILLVWFAIEELGGDMFALVLGMLGITFSVLLRLNMLFQPNSADVLCWTAFYYATIRYLATEKPKWLYVGALVFAIGFLNKYNIIFLVLGMVPAFLVSGKIRLLLRKDTLMAAALGLVLVSTNLWWQYSNGFPVVHHMAELRERQLVHVQASDFIISQLLFFAGSLPVILSGLWMLSVGERFRKFRVFLWSFIFTIALFLIFKAKDYYAIGVYPIYIAFGSVAWSFISRKGFWRVLRPLALMLPLLFFAKLYQISFPNKTPESIAAHPEIYRRYGILRWEDGKEHQIPQDYADMLGWKELAKKVDNAVEGLDLNETLVLCDNYGQAGAINYYSKRGLKAVTFNADYLNWFKLDRKYKNLIRVKNRWERNKELAETSPYFGVATLADSVTNSFSREFGTSVFIFKDARIDINKPIREEIEENKWH